MEPITIAAIKDNSFARQFETNVPEGLITVEYSFQERKIFLTKINLPDQFENEEFIDSLIKAILENATEQRLRVVPIYPRIVQFFKKNPSYKELLPPGIRI
ncbi:GNAT family N-acetyltransferase [Flavobacterium agrisoli]|uniref:N-acetyltransferase n=1 Tax=Flavobacterium agrisoli TaxID=2793066 RepID=A0A934PQI0_9FLAO|nr:N-acetyltransferase [Flavobacterium agrisoli]MBK0370783.1 N-acetyltransferase [Flavobacterium agrisoli]